MNVVCLCFDISEEQIREVVRNGAHTVEAVGEETQAGTGCGACQENIQKIIDEEILK